MVAGVELSFWNLCIILSHLSLLGTIFGRPKSGSVQALAFKRVRWDFNTNVVVLWSSHCQWRLVSTQQSTFVQPRLMLLN